MTTLKPQTTFSDLITPTTVYSLYVSPHPPAYPTNPTPHSLAMTAIITFAILSSRLVLPRHASLKTRFLFIWHAFDFTTHFAIEAPYLYNCFYTFLPINSLHSSSLPALLPGLTRPIMAMTPPGTYFKNEPSRLYGAFYGEGVTAKLWQEYARADRRWGGADLGIVSLELLTCGVMAPLAVAVCVLLARGKVGAAWFWAAVVATGELYGGAFCLSYFPHCLALYWFHCCAKEIEAEWRMEANAEQAS